ncbi:MAG: multicopper oxidase domain-containing protein [Thermoleophilia bacterium]|nr:multicopper oxidase domain-containing protein [Thermoleophilia bacterium]
MSRRVMVAAGIALAAGVAGAVPLVGQTTSGGEPPVAAAPAATDATHEHAPAPGPQADPAVLAAARKAAFAPEAPAAAAASKLSDQKAGTVREYWIKAVNVPWDVAPNGLDPVMGREVPIGQRTLTAIVYRAYTRNWAKPLANTSASGDNDGIPGPLIEARVGDKVLVHFKNDDQVYKLPHSMHFHAFFYGLGSDGAFIPGISGRGGNVPVGKSFTYRLTAGPQSAGVWPYHDHSKGMHDGIPKGLYGAIAILRKNEKPPDRRFIVAFENTIGYDTINGRAFIGNTPTFRARVGETVEWNVISLGDNFHTFHVHGHRWLNDAKVPEDTRTIGPGESFRVKWTEDAPGTWYYHCHVESHMNNGMIGLFKVDR